MKMRSLLAGAASVMLALTLAACGGGGSSGDGDVPTLRRGISAKVDTLDPHKSSAAWENIIIGDMMIGLTTDDANGKPIPGMAESWEVDESGTVWTFKLGDYTWSDGAPVTPWRRSPIRRSPRRPSPGRPGTASTRSSRPPTPGIAARSRPDPIEPAQRHRHRVPVGPQVHWRRRAPSDH